MINVRQIAEQVGLLHVTCRHCRRKTKMGPVFDEFIEQMMATLARGERLSITGFGAFFTRKKKANEIIRYGKKVITREGVSVKFKLCVLGVKKIGELYDIFKEKDSE